MPPKWTAEVVGQMHLLGITEKQLAERAGLCLSYLSEILHGRRQPKHAEQKVRQALESLTMVSQKQD